MVCSGTTVWFYGNRTKSLTGTYYGVLTRIHTPSSLPSLNCELAYWVGCRSTTLDEGSNHRFNQTTIAYDHTAGKWVFSWGYSANHLAQGGYTGLYPQTSSDYELGIQFINNKVQFYVTDLGASTQYVMGSIDDTGTLYTSDKPSFTMEGFSTDITDINVDAFKAYTFNLFTSSSVSSEWPSAESFLQEPGGAPPAGIHTYDLGSHQYLIGKTSQGSQYADGTSLW
jgi:hypothetical protein